MSSDNESTFTKKFLSASEVKPCPFCGGTIMLQLDKMAINLGEGDAEEDPSLDNIPEEEWFVFCGECGAMGPLGDTPAEAREKWNTRKK